MNYLIYARVSERGSNFVGGADDTSIPDQIAECRAWIVARDPVAVIQVVQDEFRSGGDATRPGWKRIEHDLAEDVGGWDILVVRNIARLTRSSGSIPVLEKLQARGRGLVATRENIDMSSPYGRAFLSILIALAQADREDKAEQTTMRMVAKASSGQWVVGNVPHGYRRPAAKNNALEIVPDQAETIRDIYRRYLAGEGPRAISRLHHRTLNDTWNILRNPVYKGVIRYAGKEYPGMHQPIIAPDAWQQAQDSAAPKHAPVPRKQTVHDYLLAGLATCTCGRRMTCYSSRGKSGKPHPYYQCTDTLACGYRIPAGELEQVVIDALAKLRYTPGDVDRIIAEIHTLAKQADAERNPKMQALKKEETAARQELELVARAFEIGTVTPANSEWWNQRLSAKRETLAVIQERQKILLANATGEHFSLLEKAAQDLLRLPAALDLAKDNPTQLRLLITEHVAEVRREAETWRIILATTPEGLVCGTTMASPRGFEPRLPG